jgi:Heterokaryon incompatibility protein (HET)
MASVQHWQLPVLPTRLLRYDASNKVFYVFRPYTDGAPKVTSFDILSYTWGPPVKEYECDIRNVTWKMKIRREKLSDIKRLMIKDSIEFLWVDCVCIDQDNKDEKFGELARMFEYYQNASKCHILLDVDDLWEPQEVIDGLKFVDHTLTNTQCSELIAESHGRLSRDVIDGLSKWADQKPWTFDMNKRDVKSAAIDLGVLNCYSTCISRVTSLFDNLYFSRVWTFEEMLLGKNITLWGINDCEISCIGVLGDWINLALHSKDRAYGLQSWILASNVVFPESVQKIIGIIEGDKEFLDRLEMLVQGINSARTDILNGGPSWWKGNYRGVSNIFSAVSFIPRACEHRADIFKGLLGVFSGLFTADELRRDMNTDDINAISFAFFKQLSIKTGYAWTKLAISSGKRGNWDWIPMIPNYDTFRTTDCFSGVVTLGGLTNSKNGLAMATATTGIDGVPRNYMKIILTPVENRGFQFYFKGCNSGKRLKTGIFSSMPIHTNDQSRPIVGDQTGKTLVECATILWSVMDPGSDVVQYRKRLLGKLQPNWRWTDPNAKPRGWIERCVNGTPWEIPHPYSLRSHNYSMNYNMIDMIDCGSRLENSSTANMSCEVRVNCGCKIIAPFSFVFEAITAVNGSPLGARSAVLDDVNRIILRDGLGLVQVGDMGGVFNVVAFGGHIDAHKSHASLCRKTNPTKPVIPKLPWPIGRALVGETFTHGITAILRDYGYIETGGRQIDHGVGVAFESCGNLLICKKRPIMGRYKIIGVCIDGLIANKKGTHTVTIR